MFGVNGFVASRGPAARHATEGHEVEITDTPDTPGTYAVPPVERVNQSPPKAEFWLLSSARLSV